MDSLHCAIVVAEDKQVVRDGDDVDEGGHRDRPHEVLFENCIHVFDALETCTITENLRTKQEHHNSGPKQRTRISLSDTRTPNDKEQGRAGNARGT